jgi:hypothetical protein
MSTPRSRERDSRLLGIQQRVPTRRPDDVERRKHGRPQRGGAGHPTITELPHISHVPIGQPLTGSVETRRTRDSRRPDARLPKDGLRANAEGKLVITVFRREQPA